MSSASRRRLSCAAALAVIVAACGVDNFVGATPFGSVITLVDSSTMLPPSPTFAMPDTVIETSASIGIDHSNDHRIVARVRENLVALGWREVSGPGSAPDVLVLNAAATRIETGVAYGGWFDSWGYLPYWGPSVDGSWGWGAPVGAVAYSFEAGTLLTVMLDIRAPNSSAKRIPIRWAAAVDGVVNGTSTIDRVIAGIDQAFAQSPYLRVQ